MKRYVYYAVGAVITISLLLIGYGFYLNMASENNIAMMMERRANLLEAAKVEDKVIEPQYSYGHINLYSDTVSDAVAHVEGMVTEVYVRSGEVVKKGQPLCLLRNDDLPLQISQLQSKIATAQANHVRALNDLKRSEKLVAIGADSVSNYDAYVAAEKAAAAEVDVLNSELLQYEQRRESQLVTAPVDGDVLILYAGVGNYVQQGESLVLVGDFSKLYLKDNLLAEDVGLLRVDDADHYLLFSDNDFMEKGFNSAYRKSSGDKINKFAAKLVKVEPPLTEEAAIYNVIWQIDNSNGMLEPGIYNNVKLVDDNRYNVLAVPVQALFDVNGGQKGVYVVSEKGYLQLRYIKTGIDDGVNAEVISGLSKGENVVVSGKEGLTEGSRVEVRFREAR